MKTKGKRSLLVACIALCVPGCGHSVMGPSESLGGSVDVLDYVIGPEGARYGDMLIQEFLEASRVCWLKYGDSNEYECWRWDDQWVYHDIDHALDGRPGWSYRLSKGYWMPRHLNSSWVNDFTDHITYYSPTGEASVGIYGGMSDGTFPYTVQLSVEGNELVMAYAPHAPGMPAASVETFRFRKGLGWYQWSGRGHVITFDKR